MRENLLRLKVPDETEELEALWEETGNLNTIDLDGLITDKPPLPVPSSYQDWFSYFDTIDLRKHLQEVEIVLIEAALRKKGGQITGAAEALKLRRTTLIEKMKKADDRKAKCKLAICYSPSSFDLSYASLKTVLQFCSLTLKPVLHFPSRNFPKILQIRHQV